MTKQSPVLPEKPLNNHSNKPLSKLFKKLLCRYASYYDGTLNRFELNSNDDLTLKPIEQGATQNNEQKLPLLIVARSFYSEQAKHYPIENKKELKKLLNIEFSSANGAGEAFYHAWGKTKGAAEKTSASNAQSAVNIWQFKSTVPAAYVTLPESLLLATITNANQVLTLNTHKPCYITQVGQLIHSVNKTAVVNTAQRFAMSVGTAEVEPSQVINSQSLPSMLALGLKKLSLPLFSSFITLPNTENRVDLIKKTALPALTVLILYLASTSAYLTYKKHDLQQRLSVQRSNVSPFLVNDGRGVSNGAVYQH